MKRTALVQHHPHTDPKTLHNHVVTSLRPLCHWPWVLMMHKGRKQPGQSHSKSVAELELDLGSAWLPVEDPAPVWLVFRYGRVLKTGNTLQATGCSCRSIPIAPYVGRNSVGLLSVHWSATAKASCSVAHAVSCRPMAPGAPSTGVPGLPRFKLCVDHIGTGYPLCSDSLACAILG